MAFLRKIVVVASAVAGAAAFAPIANVPRVARAGATGLCMSAGTGKIKVVAEFRAGNQGRSRVPTDQDSIDLALVNGVKNTKDTVGGVDTTYAKPPSSFFSFFGAKPAAAKPAARAAPKPAARAVPARGALRAAPAKPAARAVVKPAARAVVKPAARAVIKPAASAVPARGALRASLAKPAARAVVKPAARAVVKPAARAVIKPAARAAVKPAARPAPQAAAKPAAAAKPVPARPAPVQRGTLRGTMRITK